jgi:hypothetical protein
MQQQNILLTLKQTLFVGCRHTCFLQPSQKIAWNQDDSCFKFKMVSLLITWSQSLSLLGPCLPPNTHWSVHFYISLSLYKIFECFFYSKTAGI